MQEQKYAQKDTEIYYGVGSFLLELVKIFLLAVVIIMPIRIFLFQPFLVKGASMEPNFHDGDYLIISEWGYKQTDLSAWGIDTGITVEPFKEVQRGDVVVVRSPDRARSGKTYFIKRVVGLPGETVVIENGYVRVINQDNPDGFTLDESEYLAPVVKTSGSGITLEDDEYFVMGDNRGNSSDSRVWGALPKENVIGTVSMRVLPVTSFEIF